MSKEDFVDQTFVPYAEAYRSVIAPSAFPYIKDPEHDVGKQIGDRLQWLNRIGNTDWIPPALLFLAQDKKQPHPWNALQFFSRLERLAAYLQICQKSVNKRIARYAMVLAALEELHARDKVMAAVELSPGEIKEMQEVLNGNIYEMPSRAKGYLLRRLDSFCVRRHGGLQRPEKNNHRARASAKYREQ